MPRAEDIPMVAVGLGDDVAKEVLQWIGAFRRLTKAMIVSFNMQDYDFWGHGRLSTLLLRQLAMGAKVVVMTTPPPGSSGASESFRTKLVLLEQLDKNGAEVYLHARLHAKAYLFQDSNDDEMLIVGSPNLTVKGFGRPGVNRDDLIELALLTGESSIWSSTSRVIETRLLGDPDTVDFPTWVGLNHTKVAQAKSVKGAKRA